MSQAMCLTLANAMLDQANDEVICRFPGGNVPGLFVLLRLGLLVMLKNVFSEYNQFEILQLGGVQTNLSG